MAPPPDSDSLDVVPNRTRFDLLHSRDKEGAPTPKYSRHDNPKGWGLRGSGESSTTRGKTSRELLRGASLKDSMSTRPSGDWIGSLRLQRNASTKNWTTAFLLSVCLGLFGADRFYLGRIGLGILKLLTFGGYLVWWIIDVILLLQGRMKDDLGREVRRV